MPVLRAWFAKSTSRIAFFVTRPISITRPIIENTFKVLLMGLVTKNAILLVDFANQARKAGATVADAVLQAGLIRMRPIIMTTAAMVFGMLPMAIALNDGGEIQAPMGRAIIGGVITSTLLTLVVVPVLYSYLARMKKQPRAHAAPVVLGGSAAGPLPMPADRD